MAKSKIVTRHTVVSLQYSLCNENGVLIRAAASAPVVYVHGCGTLFPKLEKALDGHQVGDVVEVKLLPDDGFGKRDTDLLHEVPLTEIPATEDIQAGGQLIGSDTEGNEVPFRVTEVRDGIVYLDGNNPLAGQTLIFEVEIQTIRDATPEEITRKTAL